MAKTISKKLIENHYNTKLTAYGYARIKGIYNSMYDAFEEREKSQNVEKYFLDHYSFLIEDLIDLDIKKYDTTAFDRVNKEILSEIEVAVYIAILNFTKAWIDDFQLVKTFKDIVAFCKDRVISTILVIEKDELLKKTRKEILAIDKNDLNSIIFLTMMKVMLQRIKD